MWTTTIRFVGKRSRDIRGLSQIPLLVALVIGTTFTACVNVQATPIAKKANVALTVDGATAEIEAAPTPTPTLQTRQDRLSSDDKTVASTVTHTLKPFPTSTQTHTPSPTPTSTNTPTSTPTPQPEGYIAVSSGFYHSCALKSNGEAECWGSDFNRQSSPPSDERFVQISSGERFTCGISEDASVKCWGQIWYDNSPPTDEFLAIFTEDGKMCAVLEHGTEMCWRYSVWGDPNEPGYPLPEWGKEMSTDVAQGLICSEFTDASWDCWAQIEHTSASPPTDLKFTTISSGDGHVCGLLEDGSPRCWGGRWAEIPDEMTDERFESITSGFEFTCAV